MILALDDNPARLKWFARQHPGEVQASDAAGAILELASAKAAGLSWTHVYLDHDLGDEEYADSAGSNTGMEVVRWIVANRPRIDRITVHSHNERAGPAMVKALKRAGYKAEYLVFLRLVEAANRAEAAATPPGPR